LSVGEDKAGVSAAVYRGGVPPDAASRSRNQLKRYKEP